VKINSDVHLLGKLDPPLFTSGGLGLSLKNLVLSTSAVDFPTITSFWRTMQDVDLSSFVRYG